MRSLTAQDIMFRAPSGNTVKTDVSRGVTKNRRIPRKVFLGNAPALDPCVTCHKLYKDPRPVARLGKTSKTQLRIKVSGVFIPASFPLAPHFFQGKPRFSEDLSSELFFQYGHGT